MGIHDSTLIALTTPAREMGDDLLENWKQLPVALCGVQIIW